MVALFTTGTVHGGTVHGGTVHGSYCSRGTVHRVLFTGYCSRKAVFGFLARVRARADNVFKGNVNNREIV